MKILHVGWGFQPYRRGGLIEYAEDLMEIQVKNGYQVFYFCTGRFNIFLRKPTVKKWINKRGYQVFELMNPPIISGLDNGINKPLYDVTEQQTEIAFKKVLDDVQPDIVHFQEFLGIPTTILNYLKNKNIKSIYTVEDYFPLCPTLKLVKYDSKICTIKGPELGKECSKCCMYAPKVNLKYKIDSMFGLFENRTWAKIISWLVAVKKLVKHTDLSNSKLHIVNSKAEEFNARRTLNIKNLYQCDLILAMSERVASIFSYYGNFENMKVLNLTLNHIKSIHPNKISIHEKEKITFGLINAMGTKLKGKDLMLETFEMIANSAFKDKLKFIVLGDISDNTKAIIKKYPFVEYKGRYQAQNLNFLLESLKIQVGILPSVWEEAYGYVGIEFIAKGIPIIGNNIGGILDYLKDEETGWLNHSCTANELFELITNVIDNPQNVEKINRNLLLNRGKYVKDMQYHFREMNKIYEDLIQQNLDKKKPDAFFTG